MPRVCGLRAGLRVCRADRPARHLPPPPAASAATALGAARGGRTPPRVGVGDKKLRGTDAAPPY
jgi:hypothetical protein